MRPMTPSPLLERDREARERMAERLVRLRQFVATLPPPAPQAKPPPTDPWWVK